MTKLREIGEEPAYIGVQVAFEKTCSHTKQEHKMNNAEHIYVQVQWLAEKEQITVPQCVELIQGLTEPYINAEEPKHFAEVNQKLHRWLEAISPAGEGEDL